MLLVGRIVCVFNGDINPSSNALEIFYRSLWFVFQTMTLIFCGRFINLFFLCLFCFRNTICFVGS